MDVTQLSHIPPWQWPTDSADVLAKALEDRQAPASERLLAAELAGEIVAMTDEVADLLLSLLAEAGAAAETARPGGGIAGTGPGADGFGQRRPR